MQEWANPQQQKEMTKGGGKPEDTNTGRGKSGKLVPARKCGVYGKDGVRHKDEDC